MKMKCISKIFYIVLAGLICAPGMLAFALDSNKSSIQTSLVSEYTSIYPGQSFLVGIKVKAQEGWHTYWKNPGDSGLATRVDWRLPHGFTAGELQWPIPGIYSENSLSTMGYSNEVLLLSEIQAPSLLATGLSLDIYADVRWLACKDICVPGQSELSITVNTAEPSVVRPHPENSASIELQKETLPIHSDQWNIRSTVDEDNIYLIFKSNNKKLFTPKGVQFYPFKREVVDLKVSQAMRRVGDRYILTIPRIKSAEKKELNEIGGVLKSDNGWGYQPKRYGLIVNQVVEPIEYFRELKQGRDLGRLPTYIGVLILLISIGLLIVNRKH